MKHLSYDEVRHRDGDYRARYAIDWERGERKYKVPMAGVRVYENGLIEVSRMGYNDPAWRYDALKQLDLDFRLRSEFGGLRFFDPNTGCEVRKAHVQGNLFLYDAVRQRIYTGANYSQQAVFTFISQHAQPIASSELNYRVPNKKRFNERIDALKECFAFGETLTALNAGHGPLSHSVFRNDFLKNEIPPDLTSERGRSFCVWLHRSKLFVVRSLFDATKDSYLVKYLNVKEK
jgi:hypothetical protein